MSSDDNLQVVTSTNNVNNSSTSSLVGSPPLAVTIDTPSLLQSIEMLNLRVITKYSEELEPFAKMIQSYSCISLKGISSIQQNNKSTHKLWDTIGKSDYSVFLKHDRYNYNDQDAYANFIPSLQVFIVIFIIMSCRN